MFVYINYNILLDKLQYVCYNLIGKEVIITWVSIMMALNFCLC
nr:MAG TPA: hypothetical protein [Caudoviricetes sp.]